MTSPRPYVVAAAAAVLAAVCFVPSASASPDHAPARATSTASTPAHHSTDKNLADTGAVDTTPYLVGGAAFLVVGAGLLVDATRRSRAAAALPTI